MEEPMYSASYPFEQSILQNRTRLAAQLDELCRRMYLFAKEYGVSDVRTETLVLLHEFVLVSCEFVGILPTMSAAELFLTETVSVLDEAQNAVSDLFELPLARQSGLFERMKRRRRARKAMRSVEKRLLLIESLLYAVDGASPETADPFGAANAAVRDLYGPCAKSRRARRIDLSKTRSMQMVLQHLKEKNGETPADEPPTSDVPTGEAPLDGRPADGSDGVF